MSALQLHHSTGDEKPSFSLKEDCDNITALNKLQQLHLKWMDSKSTAKADPAHCRYMQGGSRLISTIREKNTKN